MPSMTRLPALTLALVLASSPAASAAALTWPSWLRPAAAPMAAGTAEATAFADALRDAVSSGEWSRVAPLFPRQDAAVLGFLKSRWHEMRLRQLDPVAWKVAAVPYYLHGGRLGVRLSVAAVEAGGHEVGDHWDVELVRRGDRWLLGDDLPTRGSEVQVTAHELDVDLTKPGRLAATDTLTLAPEGPDRRLFLNLDPGLRVTSATANGQAYPVAQHGELVYLELPEGAESARITLHFAGALPGRQSADAVALSPELAWYPRPADRGFASYTLAAHVAAHLQAAAAGELAAPEATPQGSVFHWSAKDPISGEGLYVGPYSVVVGDRAGVRMLGLIRSSTPPQLGAALLEDARVALDFYGSHYGKFPHRELALVQLDGAVPPSACTAVGIPTAALGSAQTAFEAVARGVAGAWTTRTRYVGTPDERRFMSTGVAAYMALLYRADRLGAQPFRAGLEDALKVLAPPAQDDVLVAEVASQSGASGAVVPMVHTPTPVPTEDQKAEARAIMVLHMLRKKVGNGPFDQAFRALYGDPQAGPVDLARFRKAFEKASGKHLEGFFSQWLATDDVPSFTLADVAVEQKGKGRWEVSGEVVQPLPAFALALPMVVATSGKPILYSVPVRGTHSTFRLVAHSAPRKLLVDPLHDVLAAPVEPLDLDQ